jgi:hypothetical protein
MTNSSTRANAAHILEWAYTGKECFLQLETLKIGYTKALQSIKNERYKCMFLVIVRDG